jgi:DNA invertase Pin-like site-specific DNA recombinase
MSSSRPRPRWSDQVACGAVSGSAACSSSTTAQLPNRALSFRTRRGRNLRHLVTLLDEMQAVGVAFVSLNEGIDTGTPAGRLQLHVLAALAQFERERIRERVLAGLQRARAQGKRLGRPRQYRTAIPVPGGSVRAAALIWGVSKSTAARWIKAGSVKDLQRGGAGT